MKRDTFSEGRDKRIANEATAGSVFMCRAEGCPNRWSVAAGITNAEKYRGLCSAHAWSDAALWPQITQEQLDAETDRARAAAEPKPTVAKLTLGQKLALLERMRRVFSEPFDPHAWAHRLQAKRDRGEQLSPAQRHCLAEFERHRSRGLPEAP